MPIKTNQKKGPSLDRLAIYILYNTLVDDNILSKIHFLVKKKKTHLVFILL